MCEADYTTGSQLGNLRVCSVMMTVRPPSVSIAERLPPCGSFVVFVAAWNAFLSRPAVTAALALVGIRVLGVVIRLGIVANLCRLL